MSSGRRLKKLKFCEIPINGGRREADFHLKGKKEAIWDAEPTVHK